MHWTVLIGHIYPHPQYVYLIPAFYRPIPIIPPSKLLWSSLYVAVTKTTRICSLLYSTFALFIHFDLHHCMFRRFPHSMFQQIFYMY